MGKKIEWERHKKDVYRTVEAWDGKVYEISLNRESDFTLYVSNPILENFSDFLGTYQTLDECRKQAESFISKRHIHTEDLKRLLD